MSWRGQLQHKWGMKHERQRHAVPCHAMPMPRHAMPHRAMAPHGHAMPCRAMPRLPPPRHPPWRPLPHLCRHLHPAPPLLRCSTWPAGSCAQWVRAGALDQAAGSGAQSCHGSRVGCSSTTRDRRAAAARQCHGRPHSWKSSAWIGERWSVEGHSLATAARSGSTPRLGVPRATQCAFTARHSATTAGGGVQQGGRREEGGAAGT